MKFIFDLGKVDKEGHFTTTYSNYEYKEFKTKDSALIFAEGLACGLQARVKKGAVRVLSCDRPNDDIIVK